MCMCLEKWNIQMEIKESKSKEIKESKESKEIKEIKSKESKNFKFKKMIYHTYMFEPSEPIVYFIIGMYLDEKNKII